MIIESESQLLDEAVRARIIEEIKGAENIARKNEMFKRYEVYKDRTYRYVVQRMLKLFDRATVEEMAYAISNISIGRKIVNKLARVYNMGVKRSAVNKEGKEDEKLTAQVEGLAKLLKMNTKMKKTNHAYKRDKNTLVYPRPYKIMEDGEEKYDIEIVPLFPYLYDVVEDMHQREKPMCVILSPFSPPALDSTLPITSEVQAGIHSNSATPSGVGDKKDQGIADTPEDQDAGKNKFIWWSANYHFTTDEKGHIISGENLENEIKELPFVNFAEDQDGAYWAKGGEDLVDGSILINSLISHKNHTAVSQGYGMFYMTGKNLPKGLRIGPTKGIRIEYEKDDPTPQLGFLSSNPPLAELKAGIEMYVALLLTTNNLSVSGVATQLGNSATPAAGISLIIDKAESMEDVVEQQQIFLDNEPVIWKIVSKWINLYKSRKLLASRFNDYSLPEDVQVQLKFPEPRPIMTEKEKLENLEARKNLGINTMVDLVMMDDSALTKDQAEEKLKVIAKENLERMAQMIEDPNDEGDEDPGDTEQDDDKPGAGPDGDPKE